MSFNILKYLIVIFFIGYNYCSFGQIKLVNIDISKCENEAEFLESSPSYKLKRINDSILQIETRIIANCIGVHHARIKEFGPIINLDFDDFVIDSITNKDERLAKQYDCICSFNIKWDISGFKKDSDFVYLTRGRIFKNYNSKLLDEILYEYKIDQGRLLNVVDKNKKRQWRYESKKGDSRDISFYIDGILEK